ncbi:archease [Candidatus Pacearchaeota archaeon]|nr:archease [Candidatus Pacearchaeota archaeon]
MKYKFLPHTADVKFKAYGKTLNESFENSALAMFNVMYTGKIKSSKQIKFSIKGKDFENLLYLFLEKLLILLDSKNFLVSKIKVKINIKDMSLNTLVYGDNSGNYSLNTGIKSVTYNEMFVKKIDGKWVCQVVLDV